MSKIENRVRLINRLRDLGFTFEEANQLRRIEMTLHRWAEEECNGTIQRSGEDGEGKPLRYFPGNNGHGPTCGPMPIADREKGALKRLDAILARHPGLVRYQQTDPRGCALYILKQTDVGDGSIDSVYNRGVAVCD